MARLMNVHPTSMPILSISAPALLSSAAYFGDSCHPYWRSPLPAPGTSWVARKGMTRFDDGSGPARHMSQRHDPNGHLVRWRGQEGKVIEDGLPPWRTLFSPV